MRQNRGKHLGAVYYMEWVWLTVKLRTGAHVHKARVCRSYVLTFMQAGNEAYRMLVSIWWVLEDFFIDREI